MSDLGGIHEEHPFVLPPHEREPVRRFRGRLAAPVTIVTSGGAGSPAGLTVSSILVAEGEPSLVYVLVGPTTDLFDAIEVTERFVVHVCDQDRRTLADVFAGIRPSPGGPFAGIDVEPSPWGPVIADLPERAFCSRVEAREESYGVLMSGTIDRLELAELDTPLVYFRGSYRRLA